MAAVRSDKSLSAADKCDVVAYAENLNVVRAGNYSSEQRLDAYERIARSLMADFPEAPKGYEMLFGVAHDRSEASAVEVAFELLEHRNTPDSLKSVLHQLLNRHALIGQRFDAYVARVSAATKFADEHRGRAFAIYSWATWAPRSVELARAICEAAPADWGLLGINMDAADGDPREVANAHGLKGVQLSGPPGSGSELASMLAIPTPGMIYLVDTNGNIRSVSAHRDVVAAVAAFEK